MIKKIKYQPNNNYRKRGTAIALFSGVAGMVGLAFASEPLYRIFCEVTGYAGTTQVASAVPKSNKISQRVVAVRFDANVNSKMPWTFKPVQSEVKVRLGEQALAYFEATNDSNRPLVGTASFNVTPYKAAIHFNKIDCFCFTQQVLKSGETMKMPVTFFIDPELAKDSNADDLRTITLSYTFFQDDDQSAAKNLSAELIDANDDVNSKKAVTSRSG